MARTDTKTDVKPEKVERVAALKERIESSDALLITEYRGLSVSEITDLRRSLREGGTAFAVVKNTLMQRAVTDAGHAELTELLTGPSAVAFVAGDVVAAAKAIRAASRQYPMLVLKGGFMDGQMLDAAQATGLADLASREEMLSQIVGLLQSDMAKAASLFQAAQSKFLSVLEAFKEKAPAGDDPAETPLEEAADASTDGADATTSGEATADDTNDDATPDAGDETSTEEE
jgi:large subunit ribosomal protein L10